MRGMQVPGAVGDIWRKGHAIGQLRSLSENPRVVGSMCAMQFAKPAEYSVGGLSRMLRPSISDKIVG